CGHIYRDYASGSRRARAELDRALEELKAGDTLVVWKFDRLGRSLQHLIETVNLLGSRGVQLWSVTEQIDTSKAAGRMIFGVLGALAEFERDLISERTKLAAMRRKQKNQHWGRPSVFHDAKNVAIAKSLLADPNMSRADVARHFNMRPSSLYKWFPGGRPEGFGTGLYGPGPGAGKQGSKAGKKSGRK
ncbi:MAG: recombinase family protein, partial [Dehalococcoidia bacterium]|nr:recombinase family protein [Dehalococcoidia bacterium]